MGNSRSKNQPGQRPGKVYCLRNNEKVSAAGMECVSQGAEGDEVKDVRREAHTGT